MKGPIITDTDNFFKIYSIRNKKYTHDKEIDNQRHDENQSPYISPLSEWEKGPRANDS